MKREELALRLIHACTDVIMAEEELAALDARLGDGDLGETMVTVASVVSQAVVSSEGGIQEMLDDVATAVMRLDGAAAPLWHVWLDGLQEAAPEGDEISAGELKEMFRQAYETLFALSKGKVGDKTMMDALIPATEAMQVAGDDEAEIFAAAAEAALKGAENSKNFVSRFGRARSYGEATLGTPDAGAVSMSYFFAGLAGK